VKNPEVQRARERLKEARAILVEAGEAMKAGEEANATAAIKTELQERVNSAFDETLKARDQFEAMLDARYPARAGTWQRKSDGACKLCGIPEASQYHERCREYLAAETERRAELVATHNFHLKQDRQRERDAQSKINFKAIVYCIFFLAAWALALPAEIRIFNIAFPNAPDHAFELMAFACAVVAWIVATRKGREPLVWLAAGGMFWLPAMFVFCIDDKARQ
jgi:hypothetical protein